MNYKCSVLRPNPYLEQTFVTQIVIVWKRWFLHLLIREEGKDIGTVKLPGEI